jgi:prevent-host-death family protein
LSVKRDRLAIRPELNQASLVCQNFSMESNIYEAKTKLSQLVERAMSGEEVIVAKAGKPTVRLVPADSPPKRILGSASGTIRYAEGWDAPMTDEELNALL